MTIDKTELKTIAEACKDHQPLRFMRSYGALYIRNDNGIVFQVFQNRSFPEFMAQNKDYADLALACTPETVLALLGEIERLEANVKLNLCDYPAIHQGDLDLLISVTQGVSQAFLAEQHRCTAPNIGRKVNRIKKRIGWKKGMTVSQLLGKAEALRALAKQGAVVTGNLMDERDQLKAERDTLQAQVATLQAEPQSWQSGYDAGRKSMAGHADSWRTEAQSASAGQMHLMNERDLLKAENAQLKNQEIELKGESEALRKALGDCADELAAEIICKHGGQKLEDMHPVTRRLYDRDMVSVIEARAAIAKEQSHE